MKVIRGRRTGLRFDEQLYQQQPLYITCDQFWDGGIVADSPLSEKTAFYALAEKMSEIIKEIILALGDSPLVSSTFCEGGQMHADWSNLSDQEIFRELSERIDPKKCYQLSLPEDNDIIDLIVESNFRYFTYVSLYLPSSNTVIIPTCHTEVLVYTKNREEIITHIQNAVKHFSSATQEIFVKD